MTKERFDFIGNAIADGYGSLVSKKERYEYWKEVGRRHREYINQMSRLTKHANQ